MSDTIKLAAKGAILAEIEGAYGTDPTPVEATNAIRVEDIKVEPVFKSMDRNYVIPYMGARQSVKIGEAVKVSFKTELKGSGVAGTVPEIDPLLRSCNLTQTQRSTPTRNDYEPNSNLDSAESCTIYAYKDGICRKIVGCRGSFTGEGKAGEYGYISWDFTGIYAGPVDEANPDPTWNDTIPPRFISGAFSLDSVQAVIESLKISVGNEIAKRPSVNAATGVLQYFIKGRKMTANIDPEVVALATKNWETELTSSSLMALTATFGSAAGNKIVISAPAAQIDDLKDGEREGIYTHDMPLVLVPSAGNDELTISFQ